MPRKRWLTDGLGPIIAITSDGEAPPLAQSFVGKLARHAGSIRSGVLSVAGFGLLTAAAFTFGTWPGLVAAGVSCLLLDYTRDKTVPDGSAPEVEAAPIAAPR